MLPAKQVLDIAGTMKFLSYQDGRSPLCSSCEECEEACAHIITCMEIGRQEAFAQSVRDFTPWLRANDTCDSVINLLVGFMKRRGEARYQVSTLPQRSQAAAASQDQRGSDRDTTGDTYPKWIYRNIVVHDRRTGTLIAEHKEAIAKEIERQRELRAEELLEEDKYLMETNFDDTGSFNSEKQEYWLLACILDRQRRQQQLVW